MKKTLSAAILTMSVLLAAAPAIAAEKAPQELVDLAHTELVKLGSDPKIIEAVAAQNGKGLSMEHIHEINGKWEEAKETDEIVTAVIANEYVTHLKQLQKSIPALKEAEEIYLLDNQGALVASVKFEEDFWYGETEGFATASNGAVYVSDIEIDEDDNEYMVHAMVPVKDGDKVIGVIDIGMEVDD